MDNTIIRGSSSYLFGKAAFKKKFFRRKDFVNFAWHQFRFIWRGENANMLETIKDRALGLAAGHRVEELSALTDEVYENFLSPKLWPETVRIAQQHVAEGHEVWLVTATPVEIGEVIAQRLGLTGALGTLVARENGVLTGELDGKPLHGKAKRKAVRALAKERNISLKRSYAYSDSVNDLPMLTAVGNRTQAKADELAAELGEQLSLPVQLDQDLQELHFGAWEGRSSAELMQTSAAELGRFWSDPYGFTPPEGETLLAFEARILAAVQRLQARHAGQRLLLVTHGGVIRLLLARARGLPRNDLLQVAVGHAERYQLCLDKQGELRELI